jgi:hypothetical protein
LLAIEDETADLSKDRFSPQVGDDNGIARYFQLA